MANASLIDKMLHVVDEYEAGRLSSDQVERFIEFHMEGLERIGLREIHESRDLTYRLVRAHCSDGVEDFIDVKEVPAVVAELRRFLRSLPDGVTMAETNSTSKVGDNQVESRLARHGHISYLEIPAVNPEQSALFYEAVFGWLVHGKKSGRPSFDDPAGDLIGRWVNCRLPAREPGLLPFIYVDRIEEIVKKIVEHGGQIVKPIYPEGNLRVATFRDPSGNVLGIWEAETR